MSGSSLSDLSETPQAWKPQRRNWNVPELPTHSGPKKGRDRNSTGRRGSRTTPGVESSDPSRSRARRTSGKRSLEQERVWHDGELLRKSEVLRRLFGSASTAVPSDGDSRKYDEEVQRVGRVQAGRRLFFDEDGENEKDEYSADNEKWIEAENQQRFYLEELERQQKAIDRYQRKIREQQQRTDDALQEKLVSDSRYNGLKAEHEALRKEHFDLQRVCEEQQRAQQKLGEELCERERQVEELLEKNEELQSELFESQDLRNGGGSALEARAGEGKQNVHEDSKQLEEKLKNEEVVAVEHFGEMPERRAVGQPLSLEMQSAGLPCWTTIRAQSPFVFAHPNNLEDSVKCTPEGRQHQNAFRCSQTCQRDVFGVASQLSPVVPPPPTPPTQNKQSDEEIRDLKNRVAALQSRIDELGGVVEPIPAQIAQINAILNDKENAPPEKQSENQGSPRDRGEASPWSKDVTDVVCDRIVERLSSVLNMDLRSNGESSCQNSQQRGVLQKETHPETPAPRSTNAGRGPNASTLSSESGAMGKSPWSDGLEVSRVNRQEMLDLHKRLTWQMQSVKYQNRSPASASLVAPINPSRRACREAGQG